MPLHPPARRGPSWVGVAILLFGLLSAPAPALADEGPDLSARVRAAFLFNFARFTAWPSEGGAASDGRMTYCVINDPRVAAALRTATADKQVSGQAVRVLEPTKPEAMTVCDVVYLRETPPQWLTVPQSQATLVVGEGDDFARDHGMIGFFVNDGRLRFAINTARVRGAGLQISSRLLKLARLVGEEAGS